MERQNELAKKVAKWLIFTVGLALLPLLLVGLRAASREQLIFNLDVLLQRGELLIITAALAASAVGEMIAHKGKLTMSSIVAGGAAVLITAIAAGEFADIYAGWASNDRMYPRGIKYVSLSLFACALVASTSCLILTEVEQ